MKAKNPILVGFNADPSFLRVGSDYYIATSTFEWFPGVSIHHSTDLVNWKLVSYALTDDTAVDMTGLEAACGIWAPNLTWSDGLFYLAYTIVYTNRYRYKDTYNFVATAPDVRGPWSKPVELSRQGFDPSIFHDDDGKKYMVVQTIDHRTGRERFSGIDVQEYDPVAHKLVGQPVRVFAGTKYGTTEGPNIIKKDGWYYLTVAEGGTEFHHRANVARSRSVWGPYEESPYNPLVLSYGQENCKLARAGHAQIIQGHDNAWYMAHLCARPVDMCSILGRETAIQNICWTDDGWPRMSANDQAKPEEYFDAPWATEQRFGHSQRVDFATDDIPLDYMTLRQGLGKCGVRVENGMLVIHGGCSPMSRFEQGFLARRQQAFSCDFTTKMFFEPRHLNHIAGMMVYYNYDNHYFLKMIRDEKGKCLAVSSVINREIEDSQPVYLPEETEAVYLKAQIRVCELQYFFSIDGKEWQPVGTVLDMRNISDERIEGNGFTGSMLGVHCSDCQGDGVEAKFVFFDYQEIEES